MSTTIRIEITLNEKQLDALSYSPYGDKLSVSTIRNRLKDRLDQLVEEAVWQAEGREAVKKEDRIQAKLKELEKQLREGGSREL